MRGNGVLPFLEERLDVERVALEPVCRPAYLASVDGYRAESIAVFEAQHDFAMREKRGVHLELARERPVLPRYPKRLLLVARVVDIGHHARLEKRGMHVAGDFRRTAHGGAGLVDALKPPLSAKVHFGA